MRRVDGAAGDDHLPRRADFPVPAALPEGNSRAALAFEGEPGRMGVGHDPQVRPPARVAQEGARRRAAEAPVARHLRIAHALGRRPAAQVPGEGVPRLLRRLHEAVGERQDRPVVLDKDRARLAALAGVARPVAFDTLEMLFHVIVGPAARAHLRPAVEIGRIAADEQHAVDRGRAAQHLAARAMERAVTGLLVRLGVVVPVDDRVGDELEHAGGHMDQRVRVLPARLQQHHFRPVRAQPLGEHATGGARPHDHIIGLHGPQPSLWPPNCRAIV